MQRSRDFLTLMKPEVTFLVVVATAIGYYLGVRGPFEPARFVAALIGTALVSGGTAALNMFWEREADSRMRRTAARPIPAGRIGAPAALVFGVLLAVVGGAYLWLAVNPLASCLALATLATYLLVYTPLKSRSHLCTFIGAFPGAAPPLIGWAAATGTLGPEAWALYAMLFFWQFPHFLAIAWMYRQDYARAGMRMLPAADHDGDATFRQILVYSGILVPVSLMPWYLGIAGPVYLIGTALLGFGFFASGMWASRDRSSARAKFVLHASVIYLPLVYALLAIDRRF